MRTTFGLLLTATTISAFTNSHPLIAWSNHPLPSLALLDPSHPSNSARSAFKPSAAAAAAQVPLSSTSSDADSELEQDLCSLETILLISLPGFHISDPAHFPSQSENEIGLKASLDHSKKHGGEVLTKPYLRGIESPASARAVRNLATRFVSQCGGAVVDLGPGVGGDVQGRGIWAAGRDRKKEVRMVRLPKGHEEGLDQWELVGQPAREGRRAVLERLDYQLKPTLESLARSGLDQKYLIVLSSVDLSGLSGLNQKQKQKQKRSEHNLNLNLKRRQWIESDAEDLEGDQEQEQEQEQQLDPSDEDHSFGTKPLAVIASSSSSSLLDLDFDFAKNNKTQHEGHEGDGTSIFEVQPHAGLLKRYVFFTPPLIFGLLISLLLLIPVVLIGSQALTSVQTLQGLEGKMNGAVGAGGAAGEKSG